MKRDVQGNWWCLYQLIEEIKSFPNFLHIENLIIIKEVTGFKDWCLLAKSLEISV